MVQPKPVISFGRYNATRLIVGDPSGRKRNYDSEMEMQCLFALPVAFTQRMMLEILDWFGITNGKSVFYDLKSRNVIRQRSSRENDYYCFIDSSERLGHNMVLMGTNPALWQKANEYCADLSRAVIEGPDHSLISALWNGEYPPNLRFSGIEAYYRCFAEPENALATWQKAIRMAPAEILAEEEIREQHPQKWFLCLNADCIRLLGYFTDILQCFHILPRDCDIVGLDVLRDGINRYEYGDTQVSILLLEEMAAKFESLN